MTSTTKGALAGLMLAMAATSLAARHAGGDRLPNGTVVRIQGAPASELSPGWHRGTMITGGQDCAMVATPDVAMSGGRRYLALLLVQKLERQIGGAWVDVPLERLMEGEPKACREAAGGPMPEPVRHSIPVPLGDRFVELSVADSGAELTFIRLHENEMPAGLVGPSINREVPSRYIDLTQQRRRTVALSRHGDDYAVDPNTIFSPGIAPRALGPSLPPWAIEATTFLAQAITSLLLPDAPVIALHNNRGTLLDAYASGPFRPDARDVYVNPLMDTATFAVVPTRALFEALKALRVNVVWENRDAAHDNGSLLAYAQRRGIPYVNVEAGMGAPVSHQLALVRRIAEMLRVDAEGARAPVRAGVTSFASGRRARRGAR